MKSKKILAGFTAFTLFVTAAFTGNVSVSVAAKKIKLSKKTLNLNVGKTAKVTLKNISKKQAKKIKWSCSKKAVVSIKVLNKKNKTIKITAIKQGKTNVIAKVGRKKYKCKVVVTAKKALTQSPTSKPALLPENVTTPKPTLTTLTTTIPKVSETPKVTTTPKVSETPEVITTPEIVYVVVTPTPEVVSEGNLSYQSEVTYEMTKPDYWANLLEDPDEILADAEQISDINTSMYESSKTNMYDLLNQTETYNGNNRQKSLAQAIESEVKTDRLGNRKTIYLDGEALTGDELNQFFENMENNILSADATDNDVIKYGLGVKRTDMKMAPVEAPVGWSATDADDEFNNSALNVNEPFIISGYTGDGKWYYGNSSSCNGWVRSDCVAVCDNKDEWKEMWTKSGDDILVVTDSSITLSASNLKKETSEIKLTFGTILPLVEAENIPQNIAERSGWYNYVVYVPTRDEEGRFVKDMAYISMNNKVSIGYVPLTQRNLLRIAFNCLGDRYGWGGMLDSMDCSLYTKNIYKCFGFDLPRNTTWQRDMPTAKVDLEAMTDDEKRTAISKCKVGTLLMFSGHITMYIGEVNGKQYVISDLGSVAETSETEEEINVISRYCVAINTLDVRRKNGTTWLNNMIRAIIPWSKPSES